MPRAQREARLSEAARAWAAGRVGPAYGFS